MNPSHKKYNAKLEQQIAEQRKWIREHGSTLEAYIERYGSAHGPRCYGDGGELIYKADLDMLNRLIERRG